MSSKPKRTKPKPQMLIKERLEITKKFFYKTFRNIKSFLMVGYKKIPKTPIFPDSKKLNSNLHKLENFYRSFSEQWESKEAEEKNEANLSPKVLQTKTDESIADCSKLEDLKEEKKRITFSFERKEEPSFLAADALAQKMKELEMMDVNDMDHVLDVEEVLHYYSRLTCSAYQEIVDKFFMDMYSELRLPQPSRSINNSMRRIGSGRSASVHSSMRSLGPIKI